MRERADQMQIVCERVRRYDLEPQKREKPAARAAAPVPVAKEEKTAERLRLTITLQQTDDPRRTSLSFMPSWPFCRTIPAMMRSV